MKTVNVAFHQVGRSKMCWEADLAAFNETAIVAEVKQRKALRSQCVTAEIHGSEALIYAGFHCVGMCFRQLKFNEPPGEG